MSALGLLLVLVGAALVVAEAHVPSHGALGPARSSRSPPASRCSSRGAGAPTRSRVAAALAVGRRRRRAAVWR